MQVISVVLVLLVFTFAQAKPIDIESILDGVPQNERAEFLKRHIKIGHDLTEGRDSVAGLNESEMFSLTVYNLMKSNYAIEDEQRLQVLSNIICFEDEICIDIGDVGVHPKL